jgi:hypothetical protein
MDIGGHLWDLLPNAEWDLVKWLFNRVMGAGVLTALTGVVQKIKTGSLDWWILGVIFVLSTVLSAVGESGGRGKIVEHTQSSSVNLHVWPPQEGPLYVTYWGQGREQNSAAVDLYTYPLIDGHAEKRNEYYLLLLCRWADRSVDEYEDRSIQKSGQFRITGDTISIEMKLSDQFLSTPHAELGYYVLVVPYAVSPSDIASLQGALRAGGHIIARRQSYFSRTSPGSVR